MLAMIAAIRNELVPIIIVAALLAAALRYWLSGASLPDDLSVLVTAIVSLYFGSRTGAAAATRALNGSVSDSSGSGHTS